MACFLKQFSALPRLAVYFLIFPAKKMRNLFSILCHSGILFKLKELYLNVFLKLCLLLQTSQINFMNQLEN